jgi:hypothetical protein
LDAAGAGTSSPFPFLDAYMVKIFKRFNSKAEIRIWRILCVVCEAFKDENISKIVLKIYFKFFFKELKDLRPRSSTADSYERYYKLQYQVLIYL